MLGELAIFVDTVTIRPNLTPEQTKTTKHQIYCRGLLGVYSGSVFFEMWVDLEFT